MRETEQKGSWRVLDKNHLTWMKVTGTSRRGPTTENEEIGYKNAEAMKSSGLLGVGMQPEEGHVKWAK